MPNYEVGVLISKLRKQKGMSQEELAYPVIDRATLSKIENGKALPHRKTLMFLFDKLGFDADEYLRHFVSPKDVKIRNITDELIGILRFGMRFQPESYREEKSKKANALLKQLENNQEYMSHPINKQFIISSKATLAHEMGDDEKALELIKEALCITIPNFNESNIPDYYLAREDRNILTLLATIYRYNKRYDEAVNVFLGLKANGDNMGMGIRENAKRKTIFIYNLVVVYLEAGRFQEAIDECDEGIQLSSDISFYLVINNLHWIKARALLGLGQKDEFLKLAKKVYYAFSLHGEERHKTTLNGIKEAVLAETGVDIEQLVIK